MKEKIIELKDLILALEINPEKIKSIKIHWKEELSDRLIPKVKIKLYK